MTREALILSAWRREPNLVSRHVLSNAIAELREMPGPARSTFLVVAVPGGGHGWRGSVRWSLLATPAPA